MKNYIRKSMLFILLFAGQAAQATFIAVQNGTTPGYVFSWYFELKYKLQGKDTTYVRIIGPQDIAILGRAGQVTEIKFKAYGEKISKAYPQVYDIEDLPSKEVSLDNYIVYKIDSSFEYKMDKPISSSAFYTGLLNRIKSVKDAFEIFPRAYKQGLGNYGWNHILGLPENASCEDIHQAYKYLNKQWSGVANIATDPIQVKIVKDIQGFIARAFANALSLKKCASGIK